MIFEKDNWQEIFSTIRKNKLRTVLTALGVSWGIFMLVIMLGAGNGLQNGARKGFEGTATNSFFMWAQKTSKAYKGMKPGRWYNFTEDDLLALKQIPELNVIAPMNQLGGYRGSNNVIRKSRKGAFSVNGVLPVFDKIQAIKIMEGRFINNLDVEDKRKTAVIGRRVKEMLFENNENPIGEHITINGIFFKVIGVIQPKTGGDHGNDQNESIYIPFPTFQTAFNNGNRVGWFSIVANDDTPAEIAEEKAMIILKERHQVAPEDMMAIGHWNMGKEFKDITDVLWAINFLIWFVGAGTLLAGVIGVSNIMLIIVKERTKEIGIKRAIGATPMHIISQLIIEAVFLTLLSGYMGLMGGIGLLELYNKFVPNDETSMFQHPNVNLQLVLTSLGILVIAGTLAGLYPARKAVKIHPVEALRAE